MKRILFPAALPLAVLLAACSGGADEADAPDPAETMMPVEPDGGIGDGAGPPGPVVAETIPAAFRGVWDYVEGSCDPASDMRVEIGPKTMQFYESHGDVTGVEVGSPQVSPEVRHGATSDDGRTLTPAPVGEERFEPMPLKKCE